MKCSSLLVAVVLLSSVVHAQVSTISLRTPEGQEAVQSANRHLNEAFSDAVVLGNGKSRAMDLSSAEIGEIQRSFCTKRDEALKNLSSLNIVAGGEHAHFLTEAHAYLQKIDCTDNALGITTIDSYSDKVTSMLAASASLGMYLSKPL